MCNLSNIKLCILQVDIAIIYAYNILRLETRRIQMKKLYNSPELEIYELNESVMEDQISNKDDEVTGDGSDLEQYL